MKAKFINENILGTEEFNDSILISKYPNGKKLFDYLSSGNSDEDIKEVTTFLDDNTFNKFSQKQNNAEKLFRKLQNRYNQYLK